MRVVFDVDGCLIDSAELIRQSYLAAGVVCPYDILTHEGVDWLGVYGYNSDEAAAIKRRKNLAYLHHVSNGVSSLPPYAVACRLTRDGYRCDAYTGAPVGTIDILQSQLPGWPFLDAVDGITTPERILRLYDSLEDVGVYVDDQSRLVSLPGRWHFVHYTGQPEGVLYDEIVRLLGTD